MGDAENRQQDPVWDTAWAWVLRHHDEKYLNEDTTRELAQWLAADPGHLKAYEEASHLWLLSGLVPPMNDIEIPGTPKPGDE